MIVKDFPDLPPDEELQAAANCLCAGVSKCVACGTHSHRRSRGLCGPCGSKASREQRLEQYPRMRLDGRKVYEDYLRIKAEEPELTYAQVADRLGLNKQQITNALARQRRKREAPKVEGGQYVDWRVSGDR